MAWSYRASARRVRHHPPEGGARRAGSGIRTRGVRLQDDAPAGEGGYGRFVRTISDVPAARQRPPLTMRLRPRHWTALDYAVGALFGVILFASIRHSVIAAMGGPYGAVPYRTLALAWPLAVFLVFTAVIAVALRRRQPSLMLGVLLAGSLVITVLTGPADGALSYFLPVAYVVYLVAATSSAGAPRCACWPLCSPPWWPTPCSC